MNNYGFLQKILNAHNILVQWHKLHCIYYNITFGTDNPSDNDKMLDISLAGSGPELGAMFTVSGLLRTDKVAWLSP